MTTYFCQAKKFLATSLLGLRILVVFGALIVLCTLISSRVWSGAEAGIEFPQLVIIALLWNVS